jgi:GNAT superfamily N-acetyltransferase
LAQNRKHRSSRLYIQSIKEAYPCVDCDQYFKYWVMDFDHIKGEKTTSLNKLQNCSIERIKREIAKCDLVCACCHRIRTWRRKNEHIESIETNIKTNTPETETELINIELKGINIEKANVMEAREILNKYHYAKFGRPATIIYKAMYHGETIAIVKFTPVIRQEVATKEGWKADETLELDRFCIVPKFQKKNAASRILSLVIQRVKQDKPDTKNLVSFADIEQGHAGIIYKASNWKLLGPSPVSYRYETPEGRITNKKVVYNTAKRQCMTEQQYVESENLMKIRTPGKIKYHYKLN